MIKNIILDVGDVLLEYRWRDMLMDYGLPEEKAIEIGKIMFSDPLWDELDLAVRSLDDVIEQYEKKYPEYQTEIRWFLTHGEFMYVNRTDVWEKVHALKQKGYRIYILSNYSENLFQKHTKGASFLEDADGIVVSYMIHHAKPEPEIYQYLLDTCHLNAEECIFFDDRPQNTAGAEKMGISSVTVLSREHLLAELDKLMK